MTEKIVTAIFNEINDWLDAIDDEEYENLRPEKLIRLRLSADEKNVKYIAVDGKCYEYYDGQKGGGIILCDNKSAS